MRKFICLLLAVLPVLGKAQNQLKVGQGIIKIDITQLPVFLFFTDTSSAVPTNKLAITTDSVGEFALNTFDSSAGWFKPEQLFLNYDILLFRVDTVINQWVHVYTNNDKGEKRWIKNMPSMTFYSWKSFLTKHISSISKEVVIEQPVRIRPGDHAQVIRQMETADCYQLLELKGDWIRIRSDKNCSDSKKPVASGWIRWRMQNRLMIAYAIIS